MLFVGEPGLGKTSLAQALAAEIGTSFAAVNAALVQDVGVLLRLLTSLKDRAVVFIDEIHALPKLVMEALYEALEEGWITLPVSDGRETKPVRVELPRFTMIGATTEIGTLPKAMASRFSHHYLRPYEDADVVAIIGRAAARQGVAITDDALAALAPLARGVPRAALGLLATVADHAVAEGVPITAELVRRVLAERGVDARGLAPMERHALEVLVAAGEPVGLDRWAAACGLPAATLRDQCEPALVAHHLVAVTPRGRVATVDRAQLRTPDSPEKTGCFAEPASRPWGVVREPDPREGYRVAG
jgi:Holliday junction DNA helicase RuvB